MLLPLLLALAQAATVPADSVVRCDVVVAGGTTAALAAALHAAREGAATCLLEPTDWPGGQLTAEGVSAVDFAWHRVDSLDVAAAHRDTLNLPREFAAFFRDLGNPGRCWVSTSCFEPRELLARRLLPAIAREHRLRVFYETVPIAVEREGARITALRAVQRLARRGGYEQPLSVALNDWYDATPSAAFDKRTLLLRARTFIDATPFGDLLVLANAPFLLGTDAADGAPRVGRESCTQAFVFPFVLEWTGGDVATETRPRAAGLPADTTGFGFGTFDWARVWTYRRLRAQQREPAAGELSLQNWEHGNDYFGSPLLLPIDRALAQAESGWRGGVDTAALAGAERRALAWADWYGAHAPSEARAHLRLDTTVLGTSYGLARLPYLRDTRRSIGLDDYVMPGSDFAAAPRRVTGTVHADRVALGAYAYDFRPLPGCPRPALAPATSLPYFVPFRALTNRDIDNLLVAGRTMAQSHVANGATRLQPVEWTTGLAAGVAAAWMARHQASSRQALRQVAALQHRIRRYAPLEWTIRQHRYPD